MMDRSPVVLILAVFLIFFVAVILITFNLHTPTVPSECINMNGEEIHPSPDLCNWTCNGHMDSPHMQAHLDETCRCCKFKGVDYSKAKEYQPRVYVVNPDGSQGEDRTCAYYPEAAGCP